MSTPFYVYDKETMINCYLFGGKFVGQDQVYQFEISPRMNQRNELWNHLQWLHAQNTVMVGYNNIGFDYEILHLFLEQPYTFDFVTAYQKAQQIIHGQRYGKNYRRPSDRLIRQLDLMKMNHFDSENKWTSLKDLEFAMCMENVEDLPYPFDQPLTSEQMDHLRSYHHNDLSATEKFFMKCWPMIQMRQELLTSGVLSGDVLNYTDVKIGEEYLVKKIGRNKCFNGRNPRQTIRTEINFSRVILPNISFQTQPYQDVLNWFSQQTMYIQSKSRPSLKTQLAGIPFVFGAGGVHASVDRKFYASSDTHVIKDVDVAGMYPAVAIANQLAPEHLGADFVSAYRQLSEDRKHHAKGSVMNLILKLANNGVYGKSNNVYSSFYDPQYTFSVTVNGQLFLIMLVEMLAAIPGVEIIQANTDGVTALVPKAAEPFFDLWCQEWEKVTRLKLEHAHYKRMWIRDVNNYIAESADGKVKLKGAYWWPKTEADYQGSSGSNWNKDFSNLVAQKGVERVLVDGFRPQDIVYLFTNPFDFMLRYKTTAGAKLYIGDRKQQRTVRYYVSTRGEPMKKIAIPTGPIGEFKRKNSITDELYHSVLKEIGKGVWDERIHNKKKTKYEMTTTSVESGWLVRQCNRASDFNWGDVDWRYYIQEIEKLVIGAPNAQ